MIGFLAMVLIRALRLTVRIRHIRPENLLSLPQCIGIFWHAHLVLMFYARYRPPVMMMISRSKDGELIASTFRYFGVQSARGSSSRGGTAALREMIRAAQAGTTIGITPDGPRGPRRVLKEGVVY